jgi:hypothetical protein
MKLITTEECVAPDRLSTLPPKNYSYLNSQGSLKDPNRYAWGGMSIVEPAKSHKTHPTLARHIKNGTATQSNRLWYENMSEHSWAPVAGIIDPKSKKRKFAQILPPVEASSEPSETVSLQSSSHASSSEPGSPAVTVEPTNSTRHLQEAPPRRSGRESKNIFTKTRVGGKLSFAPIDKARHS